MFPLKTMEQNRAEACLGCINDVPVGQQAGYGTLVRGLPALLQVNGLGATLAFLLAKAENHGPNEKTHARLYLHLAKWLHQQVRRKVEPQTAEEPENFLYWLVTQDSTVYRMAAVEATAFAIWLRRFAEAKGWTVQETG